LGIAAVGVHAAAGATLRDAGLAAAGAVGLALLFAVAALVTAAKYREHVRTTEPATTAEDRLRQATIAVLFVSAALVPFALLLLRRQSSGDGMPMDEGAPSPQTEPSRKLPAPPTHKPSSTGSFSFDLRAFLLVLLIVIGTLVLVWLIAVGIRLLRNVPIVEPSTSGQPITSSEVEDEALAEALLAGRSALSGEDARAAIIACYAAMEASLEQVGIIREQSDSPSDLLQRAMIRDLPSTGARDAATLTALFREARFSTHPMTVSQLEAARGALDAVRSALLERAHAHAQAVAS
jgi:hypothetical protein